MEPWRHSSTDLLCDDCWKLRRDKVIERLKEIACDSKGRER
jgi:hypothetical protein